MKHGCLLFVVSFLMLQCSSQGFLSAKGKQIVNGNGENVLLRGFGLGGWMLQEGYMLRVNKESQQYRIRQRLEELIGAGKTEEFYNAWLGNNTRKIDIDSLKAWGFNSVRLPMHYNLYTLPVEEEPVKGQNTWLEKGFAMTDSLLKYCAQNGMYLILDLHAAPGGQGNDLNISDRDPSRPSLWESEANRQKTIALWHKLAERYADEPWIGAYDILNEPNWGFEDPENDKNGLKETKNEPLKKLMEDITTAIRQVDKKHIIIIEGNGWGNNYNGILPPWDDNIVVSYHKYWNYNNRESIQHILKTRDQYNVPVWLGETGENSNVWFANAVRLLESNNIGWAWWPLKKMGNSNPMQILSNANYDKILAYWHGTGPKPAAEEAYDGVMKLAEASKLENTFIMRDVIDALIRQPFSDVAIPFKPHAVHNGYELKAVDYDLGRTGYAYYDLDTANYHVSTGKRTAGNRGGQYRNDGVDIMADSVSGELFVFHTEKGEWLQYTVTTEKGGRYSLRFLTRSREQGGKIAVSVNGGISPVRSLPAAGGGWEYTGLDTVALRKGRNTIRVLVVEGGFDFKMIRFNLE